jgi:hypothetical protein
LVGINSKSFQAFHPSNGLDGVSGQREWTIEKRFSVVIVAEKMCTYVSLGLYGGSRTQEYGGTLNILQGNESQ